MAWAKHRPAIEVLASLRSQSPATGEAGRQLHLLASKANLELGRVDEAWRQSRLADFALQRWWARPLLGRLLERGPRIGWSQVGARAQRLMGFTNPSAHLLHHLAVLHRAAGSPQGEARTISWLLEALPMAAEDPVLLEDIMLSSLERLQRAREEGPPLGRQETLPEVQYLFEESLSRLVHGHGDSRVAWDRIPPALHLLREGRWVEAVWLARMIPEARRPQTLWEVEALALGRLGDLAGAARAVQDGLEAHPASFRLWMERYRMAFQAGHPDEARESLGLAQKLLPAGGGSGIEVEWRLRRAEFAHLVEGDAEAAGRWLEGLPPGIPDDHHPPLTLQVAVARGQYESAYAQVVELLKPRPQDLDLLLLQAECLAGLEAWQALPPFLEQLPEAAAQRPGFWHLKGIALAHLEDFPGSREALERAAHLAPRDLAIVLDAGHACMDLGEFARAEMHWRQALHLDGRSAEALVQLASCRRLGHDPEGAKRLLRECLLHHPEREDAQLLLAELEAN